MNNKTLSDITTERARQDRKWGQQNHAPAKWLAIIGEEFAEVADEITLDATSRVYSELLVLSGILGERARRALDIGNGESAVNRSRYRKELVEVAACAIAAIESLDRNEGAVHEQAAHRQ